MIFRFRGHPGNATMLALTAFLLITCADVPWRRAAMGLAVWFCTVGAIYLVGAHANAKAHRGDS